MTDAATPRRLFVALFPPPELLDTLDQELRTVRERGADHVTWQPADRLHLTVAFLGDHDLEESRHITRQVAASHPAPVLTLRGGGRFSSALWIGTSGGAALAAIHQDLCDRLGLPAGRFTGHLTVGRSRGARPGLELVAALRCLDLGQWIPEELVLVSSQLGATPRYTQVGSYPFAPPPG